MEQIKVKNFNIINEKYNEYPTLKQAIDGNFGKGYRRDIEGFNFDYNGEEYEIKDSDFLSHPDRVKFLYNPIIVKMFNELDEIYYKVANLYIANNFIWNNEWEKYFDEFKEKWVEQDEQK